MRLRETHDPVFFGPEHLQTPWLRFAAWHKFNRYNRIPPHTLPCWELGLMDAGRLDLVLDGTPVPLAAGHYVVIPPETRIETASGSDAGLVFWLGFDRRWPVAFPQSRRWKEEWLKLQRALRTCALVPRPTPGDLRGALERVCVALAPKHSPLAIEAACMAVTAAVGEALAAPVSAEPARSQLVQPALDEIARRPDERLALGHLARLCRMSLTTFHAEFKHATGVSPRHYINQAKVARAREMLARAHGGWKVSEVAERLGFSSPAYFAVVFRRFVGTTPAEFARQSHAASAASPARPR